MLMAITVGMKAQNITHSYENVPLSKALKQMNSLQSEYEISFIYDELTDFTVTTDIHNASVPEAIRQMTELYPIHITEFEHYILVECEKTTHRLIGYVCDEDKHPIEFANIAVLSLKDSSMIVGGVSNESGRFVIPCNESEALLRVSCMGLKTIYKKVEIKDIGIIYMQTDAYALKGVTVKGQKPQYRLKGNRLVTNVSGTSLELRGNALDVLEVVPGVWRKDDKVEVFGKGTPPIYINGRLLNGQEELVRLTSKEIESVELVNNPGAKYGAEVKAVILIKTTKKMGDGLSYSLQATERLAHKASNSDQLSLRYRRQGLDVFGSFNFNHSQGFQKQRNNTYISTLSDDYVLNSNIIIHPTSKTYIANGGFNWQIDKHNAIGARYEYQGTPKGRSHWLTDEVVYKDGELDDKINYDTRWKRNNTPQHTANMYYNGEFDRLSVMVNNDYYSSVNRSDQAISETNASGEVANISSYDKVKSSMFASKGTMEYRVGALSMEGGYEYTNTNRTDVYLNYGETLPNSDDKVKEQNSAAFASATLTMGQLEMSGGIRYEHRTSDYYQYGKKVESQSRKYDNLFPNIDVTFPLGKARFTISYAMKTKRPLYSQLSSAIQYDDRFTYETGNPLLQPEITHDFSVAGIYRWVYLAADYMHTNDAITSIIDPYEKDSPVSIMSYENHAHVNNYNLLLSLSPKVSIWSPTLQLNLQGQDYKMIHNEGTLRLNNPLLFANFYNSINLGNGFTASCDVMGHTRGDMDCVTLKPSWNLNLGIVKTIGNLYMQLKATDVFKTSRNSMITYGTQMKLDKWNYSDSRSLRLTIRYSFNSTPNKYKGKGAGNAEKQRL